MVRLSALTRRLVAASALAFLTACATPATPQTPPANQGPAPMNLTPAGQTGPVRNQVAQAGEEITTIRYWKIRKGQFPRFLEASQTGVWPFFEKIGARVVGMWQVIPAPGAAEVSPDYDEVYLTTRYASLDHWAATRDAAALGGDGPDYAALQAALAVRQSLTIESKVTFLKGVVGPLPPVFLPSTGEKFVAAP
ncbi:MAG: NIPSNAP family protein [Alphaproteobacteria bacterium]|nr:NIPSNAP family protein [Alphaproteobacteria bacterium]